MTDIFRPTRRTFLRHSAAVALAAGAAGAWPVRIRAENSRSYLLGTGGGITVQSDLQAEWDEASVKAQRMLDAVRGPMPEDP